MGDDLMEPWADSPFEPRRWQREALPIIIAAIRRREAAIVSAVTGSGKSILIAELIAVALAKLKPGQCIVLTTPTQALVAQLAATVAARIGWPEVGMYYGKKKQPGRRVVVTCNPSTGKLGAALSNRVAFLICDEVHRTEGEAIREAIANLNPICQIGFTATPFRSDERETLQIWDTIAYQYTLGDAWRDGVLVPFEPVSWNGDQNAANVDQICLDMMQECTGPGVVSALTISDAVKYAEWLTDRGFDAVPVHSKRTKKENDRALEQLLAGEIRCVVHVAMLSEGVDIPSLRWICLRRPVGSRVRFVQEVGRVLRIIPAPDAWGDKTSAKVLDPHALFEEHGIAHPAALGEPEEIEEKEPKLTGPKPSGEYFAEMRPAVQIDTVSSWARRMLLVLQAEGMASQSKYPGDAAWRRKKASAKSQAAITRMIWASRFIPQPHRDSAKLIANNTGRFRAGAVSDLMGVLIAIADASHRGWTWPLHVEIPDLVV
jgi:superfamily II DNA or RNA helicase